MGTVHLEIAPSPPNPIWNAIILKELIEFAATGSGSLSMRSDSYWKLRIAICMHVILI